LHNLATQTAEAEGGLEEFNGLCMELVDCVIKRYEHVDILWIDLADHPQWDYHAVPVIKGIVHDAWNPDVMVPPRAYVDYVFDGYDFNWEINPGKDEWNEN
jgi:hypothetical protein